MNVVVMIVVENMRSDVDDVVIKAHASIRLEFLSQLCLNFKKTGGHSYAGYSKTG